VLDISFLVIGSGFPRRRVDEKPTQLLPSAPPLFATQVALFYSETNPLTWKSGRFPPKNIMGVWELSDGLFATLRSRVAPFPDERLQALLVAHSGKARLHIGEESATHISFGFATMMLSQAYPFFGEVYLLEKVNLDGVAGQPIPKSFPSSALRKLKDNE
jgi:hypothetical protein